MAIVGYGGVNSLGGSDQSYLVRTERFLPAVPELSRQMGLIRQEAEDVFYPLKVIEHGRAVDASDEAQGAPLTREQVIALYGEHVDRHIGIRVIRPEDTAEGYDPQAYVTWVEQTLDRPAVIGGVRYNKGDVVRVAQEKRHPVSHAGVLPSGMDLARLGGFPVTAAPYCNYSRINYMFDHSLGMALLRMGIPWERVEELIPRDQRGVAASVGMGAGEIIEDWMTAPILGRPSKATHVEGGIPDGPGFFTAKRVGATWNAARTAACDTGPACAEILQTQWYSAGLAFGVLLTGESAVTAPTLRAFHAKLALATDADVARLRDHPSLVSRPGAKDRSGFTLGEMAECILFMDLEIARRLGAIIYGVLWSARTAMGPRGSVDPAAPTTGSQLSGKLAIEDAARRMVISPREAANRIRFINAHLTATPAGDTLGVGGHEAVLEELGHDHRNPVWIWGQKGGPRTAHNPEGRQVGGTGIGHGLGGAGTAAFGETIHVINQGIVPPMTGALDMLDPQLRQFRHLAFPTRAMIVGPGLAWTSSQGFDDSNGDMIAGPYNEEEFQGIPEDPKQKESMARRDRDLQALCEGRFALHDRLPLMTG
jgi:3-oxoacyl-(acyl-carrier-protein) synthase